MQLSEAHIKGFRNFKDCKINFNYKSLVIGPNDIGKSNLIFALRLLLDKSLSEIDLEPSESDFYVHEDLPEISITLKFIEATEDCILSRFKENISDDGITYIQYKAFKTSTEDQKNYQILVGPKLDNMQEFDSRFYIRALNLNYIDSNRDLYSFIKREKRHLLHKAKSERTPQELRADETNLEEIEISLQSVNESISHLSYISKATDGLNKELNELSVANSNLQVAFDTGSSDPKNFVENLKLSTKYNNKIVPLGGDGRSNQIYLALWSAQRAAGTDDVLEVSINCIEEPEAHLHPHQQRKLSNYLINKLEGQVILTSHSPQIACEFDKNSIVNLFNNRPDTKAAKNGCSGEIEDALLKFGHRLNIIPAEGFFSSAVILVEGVSERIFYKALADSLEIDLDKLNISIICVEGVGFEVFKDVYRSIGIPTVVRTDLDVSKIPKKNKYRVAGVQRLIGLYSAFYSEDEKISRFVKEIEPVVSSLNDKNLSQAVSTQIHNFRQAVKPLNLFLSEYDLEWDLINSPIWDELKSHYDEDDKNALYETMTTRKGSNMFEFLSDQQSCLAKLKDNPIAEPLIAAKKIAESLYVDTN
ncbi:MAG: AAA family ATPase [Patescibacteria group bacterium]